MQQASDHLNDGKESATAVAIDSATFNDPGSIAEQRKTSTTSQPLPNQKEEAPISTSEHALVIDTKLEDEVKPASPMIVQPVPKRAGLLSTSSFFRFPQLTALRPKASSVSAVGDLPHTTADQTRDTKIPDSRVSDPQLIAKDSNPDIRSGGDPSLADNSNPDDPSLVSLPIADTAHPSIEPPDPRFSVDDSDSHEQLPDLSAPTIAEVDAVVAKVPAIETAAQPEERDGSSNHLSGQQTPSSHASTAEHQEESGMVIVPGDDRLQIEIGESPLPLQEPMPAHLPSPAQALHALYALTERMPPPSSEPRMSDSPHSSGQILSFSEDGSRTSLLNLDSPSSAGVVSANDHSHTLEVQSLPTASAVIPASSFTIVNHQPEPTLTRRRRVLGKIRRLFCRQRVLSLFLGSELGKSTYDELHAKGVHPSHRSVPSTDGSTEAMLASATSMDAIINSNLANDQYYYKHSAGNPASTSYFPPFGSYTVSGDGPATTDRPARVSTGASRVGSPARGFQLSSSPSPPPIPLLPSSPTSSSSLHRKKSFTIYRKTGKKREKRRSRVRQFFAKLFRRNKCAQSRNRSQL